MSERNRRIAELSPARLKLLAERLAATAKKATPAEAIPRRVDRPSCLPVSFPQERMMFFHQVDPQSHAFNINIALRLTGRLNVIALDASISEVVRRHESLRTSFDYIDGEARQTISPESAVRVNLVGLQDLEANDAEATVRRLATDQAVKPFDLSKLPLMRLTLLRLGEQEHVAFLTMHHIISDGWSMRVMVEEVCALYEAFSQGRPSPLRELEIQYADFALWQRERLRGELLEAQLAYWRGQLGGKQLRLNLPTDRPWRPIQDFKGAHKYFILPKGLSDALNELSAQEGVTLFMSLLAAFNVLLQRYSGQDEIAVATIIANRNRKELESLVGFFVNSLVLRADLSGDLTYRQLLSRVRKVTLDSYAHQDVPFELVAEALSLARDAYNSSLSQVMFIFQNVPVPEMKMSGIAISGINLDLTVTRFDLVLTMSELPEGLGGTIDYRPDLFDESTIAQMVEHFKVLLEGLVASPDRDIQSLPLTREEDSLELVWAFNDELE
nr:condensation domain-containing protein [uncultured bacterium]